MKANEKAAASAFQAMTTPFARVLVAALAKPEDKIRAALAEIRRSLPLWLRHFDTSTEFALALEKVIGGEFAAGLTSQSNIKASLADILDETNSRDILPTSMGSAEIRTLNRDIRSTSLFSARTTSANYLNDQAGVLDDFLSGKINAATARLRLLKSLDSYGYTPEGGFPGDMVPAAEAGSLEDLSSASRMKLILDTQSQLAFGKGQQVSGRETADVYPAWELIRLMQRAVPRGFKETKDGLEAAPGESWPERWEEAGGKLVAGRMIARKDATIWEELGSGALFDDALDTDHPPFAYNSGMGWTPVDRMECIELGIIKPNHKPDRAKAPRFDERPPVDYSSFPSDLREQLRADLARATQDADASLARDVENFKRSYAEK